MREILNPIEAVRHAYEKLGGFVLGILEKIEPMDNPLEDWDDEK